jgi:Protein of unknown function with PCYCGC motif
MRNPSLATQLRWLGLLLFMALTTTLAAGCSAQTSQSAAGEMNMAPLASMPADVQQAPISVQQAYQFAAANADVLKQVPCYCGCGVIGHTSNYACYVSGQNPDGSLAFDAHALGCSICVDITQDSMRLLGRSKTVPEIRSYVDNTYAKYGPSNMP